MITWSAAVLDSLIAPGFTKFTHAEIPDLTERFPQAPHWLGNFFLNSALRGRYKPTVQQVAIAYMRRSQQAFLAYHDARRATLDYLDGGDPRNARIKAFYAAVALWENLTLQNAMAIDLYNWFSRPERAFGKNDGSKEQRLYTIANHVKHVGSCVDSGQCTEQDTLPLWLANDGLRSFGVTVSFGEVSEVLVAVAALADLLQDPLAARDTASKEPGGAGVSNREHE